MKWKSYFVVYFRILPFFVFFMAWTAEGKPLSNTHARLSVGTEQLFLGDPVLCRVEVVNLNTVPVRVFNPQGSSRFGGVVWVFVRQPEAKDVIGPLVPGLFDGPFKMLSRAPLLPTTTIGPGKAVVFDVVLDRYGVTIQERKWFFPVAGEYRLKLQLFEIDHSQPDASEADFGIPKQPLETNEIMFQIRDPPTEVDSKAFLEFSRLHNEWLPYAPSEIGAAEGAQHEFLRFIKEHARSRYAHFVDPVNTYLDFLVARSQGNLEMSKKCLDLIEKKDLGDGWPPGWKSKLDIIRRQMRNVVFSETVGRKSGKP